MDAAIGALVGTVLGALTTLGVSYLNHQFAIKREAEKDERTEALRVRQVREEDARQAVKGMRELLASYNLYGNSTLRTVLPNDARYFAICPYLREDTRRMLNAHLEVDVGEFQDQQDWDDDREENRYFHERLLEDLELIHLNLSGVTEQKNRDLRNTNQRKSPGGPHLRGS